MSAVLFLTGRVLVLNGSSENGQIDAGGRQLRVAVLCLFVVIMRMQRLVPNDRNARE
jgi:hypothetical protein